jgi:hypothetical protein
MTTQNILAGALVAQLALAAFTWWPTETASVEPRKLFEGGGNAITAFSVVGSGEGAKAVELSNDGNAWTLASEGGYPADAEKVAEVVEVLGDLKLRTPIASKKTSHEQFKVGETGFGKKVSLTANGQTYAFYLGAAQSKSVYLRLDGSDEVYEVTGLSEWAIKDTARSYWPNDVVSFEAAELTELGIGRAGRTLTFTKAESGWTALDAPEGMVANGTALDDLVGKIATVRLSEPVGKDELPLHGFDVGTTLTWTTTLAGAATPGGLVIGAEADGKFYAKVNGNPFVVKVPAHKVKDVVALELDALLQPGVPVEGMAPPAEPPPAEAP